MGTERIGGVLGLVFGLLAMVGSFRIDLGSLEHSRLWFFGLPHRCEEGILTELSGLCCRWSACNRQRQCSMKVKKGEDHG
jgi:hypothetical protein